MKKHEVAITLILTIIFSSIIIIPSTSQTNDKYIVGIETTIVNKGNMTYPLSDMNKIILIPETEYQKLVSFKYYINNEEVDWKILGLNDEGNIEVEVYNVPTELAPNESINIKMILEVEITMRTPPKDLTLEKAGLLDDIPKEILEKYCKMEGLWSKSENVSILATELVKGKENTLQILYTFIKWIENNVRYPQSNAPKIPSYPDETLNLKVGDCDDQANLLVAMLRSVGIPAYTQLSFLFIKGLGSRRRENLLGGHLTIETIDVAGHGWAMVYIPPWGWLPVDMTYFENAKIEFGRIVSVNVEDHITGAAVFQYTSLVTENIIKTDYIEDLARWIRELDIYNLKWTEKYWMKIKVETPSRESDGIIVMSAVGLVLLSITASILYIYARKRKKKVEVEYFFPHNN